MIVITKQPRSSLCFR